MNRTLLPSYQNVLSEHQKVVPVIILLLPVKKVIHHGQKEKMKQKFCPVVHQPQESTR